MTKTTNTGYTTTQNLTLGKEFNDVERSIQRAAWGAGGTVEYGREEVTAYINGNVVHAESTDEGVYIERSEPDLRNPNDSSWNELAEKLCSSRPMASD